MYYTEKKLFLAYLLEIIFCLFDLEIHVLPLNVTLNYYQNSTIAGLFSKTHETKNYTLVAIRIC